MVPAFDRRNVSEEFDEFGQPMLAQQIPILEKFSMLHNNSDMTSDANVTQKKQIHHGETDTSSNTVKPSLFYQN